MFHHKLPTIKDNDRGLFRRAKYKYLAELIDMTTPDDAIASAHKIRQEFLSAKTKKKRMRIWRAVDLAWKRARAIQNRKDLSSKERQEYKAIAEIYKNLRDELHLYLTMDGAFMPNGKSRFRIPKKW